MIICANDTENKNITIDFDFEDTQKYKYTITRYDKKLHHTWTERTNDREKARAIADAFYNYEVQELAQRLILNGTIL